MGSVMTSQNPRNYCLGVSDDPVKTALGAARGRIDTSEELARHFAPAVLPRTTNRHGCVTRHGYHFYVEEGWPHMTSLYL